MDSASPEYHITEESSSSGYSASSASSTSSSESHQSTSSEEDEHSTKSPRQAERAYNDEYLDLLNKDIEDAVAKNVSDDTVDFQLQPSYVNATFWSREEKEAFFNALTRLGKSDLPGIAAAVESKTEFEVKAYIQVLHDAYVMENSDIRRFNRIQIQDFPAALEISNDCCESLDRLAAKMEFGQVKHEESAELKRWPKGYSILTPDCAWQLGDHGFDGDAEGAQLVLPEVRLLNLSTMLKLSRDVFMNEEEFWDADARPIAAERDRDEPCIRASAFADLHTLTVSVTRRLVQSSLFFAMSRARQRDSKIFNSDLRLTVKDVQVAVKTLGMKSDSKKFWQMAARRNNLTVYEKPPPRRANYFTKDRTPLTLDEVELLLRPKEPDDTIEFVLEDVVDDSESWRGFSEEGENFKDIRKNLSRLSAVAVEVDEEDQSDQGDGSQASDDDVSMTSNRSESSRDESQDSEDSKDLDETGFEQTDTPSDGSPDQSNLSANLEDMMVHGSREREKHRIRLELALAQDEYADSVDCENSLIEEKRLWKILGDDQAADATEASRVPTRKRPLGNRRLREEMADWRDGTDYLAPWESSREPFDPGTFENA
jgi:RNA polymerase I-specific transcription initiation factor RRN5